MIEDRMGGGMGSVDVGSCFYEYLHDLVVTAICCSHERSVESIECMRVYLGPGCEQGGDLFNIAFPGCPTQFAIKISRSQRLG
jgi:hypothetical protein